MTTRDKVSFGSTLSMAEKMPKHIHAGRKRWHQQPLETQQEIAVYYNIPRNLDDCNMLRSIPSKYSAHTAEVGIGVRSPLIADA